MSLNVEIARFRFAKEPDPILTNVNIRVNSGEIVSLMGASGVGKSTVARIACGLVRDSEEFEGSVICNGEPLMQPEAPVSLVIQDYKRAIFPWLSVKENLVLGVADRAQRRKCRSTLDSNPIVETLGISDLLSFYPKKMSGGQLQRIQIGRALLAGSSFLVLDEPGTSLDLPTRRKLYQVLDELGQHQNIGILIVTHEIDEAVLISNRIISLTRPSGRPSTLGEFSGLRSSSGHETTLHYSNEFHAVCDRVERAIYS